jgi:hypothetical protein
MSIQNTEEISLRELEDRQLLYSFYYEIMSDIKGKKIKIDKEEYEENIQNTKISTILNYIKESIPLLIKKKIEESKKKEGISENKIITSKNEFEKIISQYENQLINLENSLRHFIKKELQFKIHKESLENKIKNYIEMENEFEEMKEKFKFEEGNFLHNDKKENEIIILRAENSKLKSVINQLELDKKNSDIKSQETISDLKLQIENLAKKVYKLEQKQIYDSSISNNNSSINININNNVNSSSKCIIKNNNIQNENDINDSNKKLKRLAGSALKKPPKNKQNIEYKNLTNISNKSINSPPKNVELKSHHHKTNSVNMNLHDKKKSEIIEKYFSNNFNNLNITKAPLQKCNNNQNYKKITNLIPNSKFPISNRTQNQQIISSISKIYMRGNKQDRTGNHSSFNIRPQSKEHY